MLLLKLVQLLITSPILFAIYILVLIVPLLVSISVHEWAHGFVAYKFGDNTPKEQGRLSLNPFAHLDLVGTLMLFTVGIGWAKPVMVNPNNINGRHKLMFVALAGPASNFILAVIFLIIIYLLSKMSVFIGDGIVVFTDMIDLIVKINLVLALFNMIPLPPLDGSNVIRNLLPENIAELYFKLSPYGFPILIILLFTGAISHIYTVASFIEKYILLFIGILLDPILKIFFNI